MTSDLIGMERLREHRPSQTVAYLEDDNQVLDVPALVTWWES
jgi:hypothetical protein